MATLYQAGFSVASIDLLRHGTTEARAPLLFGFRLNQISGTEPEAQAAGVKWGEVLEQVEGHQFTGVLVLDRAIRNKHAGETLNVLVRRPDDRQFSTEIRLAPIRNTPASLSSWIISLAIQILLPICCLVLGFWVAAVRPYDALAWLLLALMIGFSQFVEGFSWNWPLMPVAIVWNAVSGFPYGIWLCWLFLFALLFPERPAFDRRRPWLKWVLLIPLILQSVFFVVFVLGSDYDFAALAPLRPLLGLLVQFPLHIYLTFAAISAFFALLGMKSATGGTADARRRLRILYFGTAFSLTPMFIAAIIGVIRGGDILNGIPPWATITALLALLLFPLTMAYVIVVQRAMEVRVVLRQGVRYALARKSLQVVRASILALAIWAMDSAFSQSQPRIFDRVGAVTLLAAAISLRRGFSERLSKAIDRRFFREAYSAELIMSELGQQARRFTEGQALLNTVAQRISETLHICRVAVFVREGESFCVTQSIGLDQVPVACLSERGRTVNLLSEAKEPELVYFDDPRNWIHSAPPDERQKLYTLNTEVLVALPGRTHLLGLIALGPKLSEEPYSPSDLRLLQSVAAQTGLALENTQLLAAVASEAGKRERLNREIEIAREVQEHLFPQSCPPVRGVDYFGLCRPALAVGGDYYDYILRAEGGLGIAVGDVSGKGISAALMMASLQSLMRGQIAAGLDDLSALLTNTNRLICDASTANRYITFFYGEYDPATRKLVYVNAGHNPPIILRGDEVFRLEACGPVLGVLRDIRYESAEFQFERGDTFIAFTDGISEAMTRHDEEWGEEGLINSARAHRHHCATQLAALLMSDADAFTAGAEQHDDMTIIALKTL
jgi:sigma-B regulation protein RsbU (phosphoserine phosphatase)